MRWFCWLGKGANQEEKDLARSVANLLNPAQEISVNEEGKESGNFWELFPNGKKNYFCTFREPRKEIRYNKKNKFEIISNFFFILKKIIFFFFSEIFFFLQSL